MMIGQVLLKGVTSYGPWSSRQGPTATFFCEAINISGATLTVTIQHKEDETATPADLGTVARSATGVGVSSRLTGIEPLWRYKYVVTGTNAYDWIHFDMLLPQWERS